MRTEDKTDKKETKNQSVDELAKSVDKLWASLRMLVKVCERHFGEDLNKDGKIGGARLSVLTALGMVVVCAGIVAATQTFTSGDIAHWGVAKITSTGTLSTDGGIVSSGAMVVSNGVTFNSLTTTVFRTMTATVNGNLTVGTNMQAKNVYAVTALYGDNTTTAYGFSSIEGTNLIAHGNVQADRTVTAGSYATTGGGTSATWKVTGTGFSGPGANITTLGGTVVTTAYASAASTVSIDGTNYLMLIVP